MPIVAQGPPILSPEHPFIRSVLRELRRVYVTRLRALATLFEDEAYSDVMREAQELVEPALKGMLRFVGVEPPKQHDVGRLLVQHRERLPEGAAAEVDRLAAISRRLRKEREFAFYGDEDFIPTKEYTPDDAEAALDDAGFVLSLLDAFPQRD
jgi:HEPN domain-containing protein